MYQTVTSLSRAAHSRSRERSCLTSERLCDDVGRPTAAHGVACAVGEMPEASSPL